MPEIVDILFKVLFFAVVFWCYRFTVDTLREQGH